MHLVAELTERMSLCRYSDVRRSLIHFQTWIFLYKFWDDRFLMLLQPRLICVLLCGQAQLHTHTHTQPFYGSLDFVLDNPGLVVSTNWRKVKVAHCFLCHLICRFLKKMMISLCIFCPVSMSDSVLSFLPWISHWWLHGYPRCLSKLELIITFGAPACRCRHRLMADQRHS